jgi:hypothetical protein
VPPRLVALARLSARWELLRSSSAVRPSPGKRRLQC